MTTVACPSTMAHVDKAFQFAHPGYLAAVATVRGIFAPDAEEARILDVCCGDGTTLFWLKKMLPGVTAVGIDDNQEAIQQARSLAAGNGFAEALDFRCESFEKLDPEELGFFDYVICHGLYSWIAPERQSALLSFIRECLAPTGLALLTYNAYPGWHFLHYLQEAAGFHSLNVEENPQVSSHAMLNYLGECFGPESPFHGTFQHLLANLRSQSEQHLVRDLLNPNSQPIYFWDVLEELAPARLQYVLDADLSATEAIFQARQDVAHSLRLPEHSWNQMEQYVDFLRCRMFRQSILCHEHVLVVEPALDTVSWLMRFYGGRELRCGVPDPIPANGE